MLSLSYSIISGREDLNLRPLGPEPSALAPALLPVCDLSILFIFAVYVNL